MCAEWCRSCAGVADQLRASPSSAAAADSSTNQQSASTSRHPGLSEAAFKRVVGDTPPTADELEKVHNLPSLILTIGQCCITVVQSQ